MAPVAAGGKLVIDERKDKIRQKLERLYHIKMAPNGSNQQQLA